MPENETNESGLLAQVQPVAIAAEEVQELEQLPTGQRSALQLLFSGKSVSETARLVGVSRMTLHRWLKSDPVFQAAYNEWHEQMEESGRSRLLMLTDKATDAVEKALAGGDARTALQLLKGMGLIKAKAVGPTDPEEVERVGELEKKKRELSLTREERNVEFFG